MRQADVPHCLPAWVQREQPINLTGQLPARRLHPVPVRIMHWTNAAAMLVMIGSGWGIYNDSVIFSALHFSKHVKLGSWAAASLLWHFAGMWLLVLNGAAYLVYGVVTGRLRERLLPIRLPDLVLTWCRRCATPCASRSPIRPDHLQRRAEAALHHRDPGRRRRS